MKRTATMLLVALTLAVCAASARPVGADATLPSSPAAPATTPTVSPTPSAALPVATPAPAATADELRARGFAAGRASNDRAALDDFQRALTLDVADQDLQGQTWDQGDIGLAYYGLNQYAQAIDPYLKSVAIDKQIGDTDDLKAGLEMLGYLYQNLSQREKALDAYKQALVIAQQRHDAKATESDMSSIGSLQLDLLQYKSALIDYQQELIVSKKLGDKPDTERTLSNIGLAYADMTRYADAMRYYNRTLALAKQIGDLREQMHTYSSIGFAFESQSQNRSALDSYQHGLAVALHLRDKHGEAAALINVGETYRILAKMDTALDCDRRALALAKQLGDRQAIEQSLDCIASVYYIESRYDQAQDYDHQALTIAMQIGDLSGQETCLGNMGATYNDQSQYAKALECEQKVLGIARQLDDKSGEVTWCGNIGFALTLLGQYSSAMEYNQRCLALAKQIGYQEEVGRALGNIGFVYEAEGEYSTALSSYQQALTIASQLGDPRLKAIWLGYIGEIYRTESLFTKALYYDSQSLIYARKVGEMLWVGHDLANIGLEYDGLSQFAKALSYEQQAMAIAVQIGDRHSQATAFGDLASIYHKRGSNSVAIFFGKQAVNVTQAVRGDISGLKKEVQGSYLKSHETIYRQLADWLIAAGRLPEAEQVLAMLKQQEYFDFIGGSRDDAAKLDSTIAFTQAEQTWIAKYASLGDSVEQLQSRITALSKAGKQDSRDYLLAEADLKTASDAFDAFLTDLPKRFADAGKGAAAADRLQDAADLEDLLASADANEHLRVCALYTVEADTQYDVVLVTPESQRAGAYPISAASLNAKVEAFRTAVMQRDRDPRGPAKDLYDIMVGPVADALTAYHPDIVMWSLDGSLSLVPVSALWDGKRYLVQKWQNTLFNAGSVPHLDSAQVRDLSGAIGMGVSKGGKVGDDTFGDLPDVPIELRDIFGDPAHQLKGPLQGTYQLDSQFTKQGFVDELNAGGHKLVHVATHFKLDPARADDSYLLTGDGALTLADLRSRGRLLRGVDLLTLSACATAEGVGPNADRNGLDATAQLLGARSILATLWDVNDASTAQLMSTFYAKLATNPAMPLSEALREAQVGMLGSSLAADIAMAPPPAAGSIRRSMGMDEPGDDSSLPAFATDPAHPYAHPYYWAPFALMGNWR